MQRAICLLSQNCSRLRISDNAGTVVWNKSVRGVSSVSTPIYGPSAPRPPPLNLDLPHTNAEGNNSVFHLPALDNARQVYTFPTLNRSTMVDPPLAGVLEKLLPDFEKPSVSEPPSSNVVPMQLAPRLLTIRRKKMKKHKRRKRYDRDFFKYQKYHREKKLKAEREFVKRMKAHLTELESFNPEKYVDQVIAEAKKEWSDELAPTGKKLYPHWSRLMSLEELYGLPKTDYIDKRAGLPTDEDWEKIKELKANYDIKYRSK